MILPTAHIYHNLLFTYIILICACTLFPLQNHLFSAGFNLVVYFTSVAMSRFQCLVPSRLACLTAYLACSFHCNQQKVRQNRIIIESQRLLGSKINYRVQEAVFTLQAQEFLYSHWHGHRKGIPEDYESMRDHHQCEGRTDYMTYGVVFPALGLHDKSLLNE